MERKPPKRVFDRSATPALLNDGAMWRHVLAKLHPDAGGGHDGFLFLSAVREALDEPCECRRNLVPGHRTETPERIPYDPSLGLPDTFTELSMRALEIGFEELRGGRTAPQDPRVAHELPHS